MRKLSTWSRILIYSISVGALAVAASLVLSKAEERDAFCISCHTPPEVAYQQRAVEAFSGNEAAQDLGSRHYQLDSGEFRCIDCHRGSGTLYHRLVTNALAARDTLIWLTGAADPALEKGTSSVPMLLNAACARCHEETLVLIGFENHFHSYLSEAYELFEGGAELILPLGQESSTAQPLAAENPETTVSCVDCHKAHVQVPGAELQGYLDLLMDVYPACETCHIESGRGPVQLAAGGS
jgi:nitrate/TMAO reductase-like tetraheme cytochrome c subunit